MTKKIKDLIILIPVFNEQKNLKKTILASKKIADVLVVDDCSTDKTNIISKKFDYLIRNKRNRGYDYSLKRGIKEILKNHDKNFIITIDGDGQHPINEILSLYNLLKVRKVDLIIGSRNKFNRISEHIVSFFSRLFINILDPYSGMKGYRIKSLRSNINILELSKKSSWNFFYFNVSKK